MPTEKKAEHDQIKSEGLDAFEDRFGKLGDRMEQAVHTELDRVERPTAEHPNMIAAREKSADAQKSAARADYLTDKTSRPEFENAANSFKAGADKGEGSKQVKADAPRHNLKPPKNTRAQDRAAHRDRMSQDNLASRIRPTEASKNRGRSTEYAEPESRIQVTEAYKAKEESRIERNALEAQTRDQGQTQDYGRER